MLTLQDFIDCENTFKSKTEYGEPQHWIYFKSGRSLEITYADVSSVSFIPTNNSFDICYYCSKQELDRGDYGTTGIICAYTFTEPNEALEFICKFIINSHHEEEKEN